MHDFVPVPSGDACGRPRDAGGEFGEKRRSCEGGESASKLSRFSIGGIVVDEEGVPVPNVKLAAVEGLGRSPDFTALSDAVGNFTLNLPHKYTVSLVASDAAGEHMGFLPFSLLNQEWGQPVRLVLHKARAITVTVVDGKGRPIAGAKVSADFYNLLLPRLAPPTIIQRVTDAEGKALLHLPNDMPLACVFAVQAGAGFDYVIYRPEYTRSIRNRQPKRIDPDQRAPDNSRPIKFVLSGVHKMRVHLVDDRRRALPGVRVHMQVLHRPNRGGQVVLFGIQEFEVASDQAGIAEFEAIPAEATSPLAFHTLTTGYFLYEQATFNPADPVTDVTAVATQLPVLRVQVTYPDGRPALGAEVHYTWRTYGPRRTARFQIGELLYDSAGEMDVADFRGDSYCVVSARSGGFASALAAHVARMGEPLRPVHLVLQPVAHVHGTLTWGKDHRPDANEPVTLIERDDGNYSKLPEGERLPRTLPLADLAHVAIDVPVHATTDAEGRFEFEVPPGRYVIGPGAVYLNDEFAKAKDVKDLFDEATSEFEIKDQNQIEINLHREEPSSAESRAGARSRGPHRIRLQVTYPDGRPAPEAITQYAIRRDRDGRLTIGTSRAGRSHIPLNEDAYCVVSATSGRFASALVARVNLMSKAVRPVHLVLNPAARVHGRLTVGKAHRPAANARFIVIQQDEEIYASLPEGERLSHLRQPAVDIPVFQTTDAKGQFEFYAATGRYVLVPESVPIDSAANPVEVKKLIQGGAREFQIKDQKDLEINGRLE